MDIRALAGCIATTFVGCDGTEPVPTSDDVATPESSCDVATHEAQPAYMSAQYLDFVLTMTVPAALDGALVRMVTWDKEGQVLGVGDAELVGGSVTVELDEGYERYAYQRFVVWIDLDGDARCGQSDEIHRGITSGWNPVGNEAYVDERPWLAEPTTTGELCQAVVDCVPPG